MPGFKCIYLHCSTRSGGEKSLFKLPRDPVRLYYDCKWHVTKSATEYAIRLGCVVNTDNETPVSFLFLRMRSEIPMLIPTLFEAWLKAAGREDLLEKSYINYKVCEDHFERYCFSSFDSTKKRLFVTATPTIFQRKRKTENDIINYEHASQSKMGFLSEKSSSNSSCKSPEEPVRALEEVSSKGITLEGICKFLDDNYPQQATETIKTQLALLNETTNKIRPCASLSPKYDKFKQPNEDLAHTQIKIEEQDFEDKKDAINYETETTLSSTTTLNEQVKQEDDEPEQRHPIQIFFDSIARTVMQFPPPLAVRAKVDALQALSKLVEVEM